MRLPFFRSKDPADERARPSRGKAGAASAEGGPVLAARTQARRRLIGALVLLAAGVVGFPVLFETQPRPLPVDTPIIVPAGTPMRAAPAAAPRPLPPPPADAGIEPLAAVAGAASAAAGPAGVASRPAESAVASVAAVAPAAPRASAAPVKAPAVAAVAAVKPPPFKPDAPKPEPAVAAGGRFVVQVGAYNDVERLRAARQKLDKLGLKTYIQDVETPDGKRTRVRVGPFANRQEAETVAAKVKASGMPANVLLL